MTTKTQSAYAATFTQPTTRKWLELLWFMKLSGAIRSSAMMLLDTIFAKGASKQSESMWVTLRRIYSLVKFMDKLYGLGGSET